MSKILGIDYGNKRTGISLSDDDKRFAFVYNTLESKNKNPLTINKIIQDVNNICKLEDVERIVVGMPLGLSGDNTKKTEEVIKFINKLEAETNIPVETQDERLSTVAVYKIKDKSSRNIDEMAAQIILQNYLDTINSTL